MGALPKRKLSKKRKRERRANDFLTKVSTTICPDCNQTKRTHFACPNCGRYKDKQIVSVK